MIDLGRASAARDSLRAFSNLLRGKIELVRQQRVVMDVFHYSRTSLPGWLRRRKTKERMEREEEGWCVVRQWEAGGDQVEMVNGILRVGEGMVNEAEQILGFQEVGFALQEHPRFSIRWGEHCL